MSCFSWFFQLDFFRRGGGRGGGLRREAAAAVELLFPRQDYTLFFLQKKLVFREFAPPSLPADRWMNRSIKKPDATQRLFSFLPQQYSSFVFVFVFVCCSPPPPLPVTAALRFCIRSAFFFLFFLKTGLMV